MLVCKLYACGSLAAIWNRNPQREAASIVFFFIIIDLPHCQGRWKRFEMSDFHNRSQTSARRSDYVWQYEYYDDEEPVSFEGLKAHRCKLDTACLQTICRCFHCLLFCTWCMFVCACVYLYNARESSKIFCLQTGWLVMILFFLHDLLTDLMVARGSTFSLLN